MYVEARTSDGRVENTVEVHGRHRDRFDTA